MLERKRANLEFAWAVFRLPLLILIALLFRHQIVEGALRFIGEGKATLLAIDVMSTPATRFIFMCLMVLALIVCAILTRNFSWLLAYIAVSVIGLILIALSIRISGHSKFFAIPAAVLLLTNLMPPKLTSASIRDPSMPSRGLIRWLMRIAIGFTEVFLFWRHVRWASGGRWGCDLPRWLWVLPGAILASFATAASLGGFKLVPIEQALRWSSTVRKVAVGDFNWIKADKDHKVLFASGHGFERLQMYDLSNWSKPPLESNASAGFPQGFEYSPSANELYVYDEGARRLQYFDASTLELKRSLDIGRVSPGDSWIAADDRTNTITIASEADEQLGYPLVVVDRATGNVVDHQPEEAGNLTLDPERSLEYLSFFRRESRVSIYDLHQHAIIKSAPIGPHAERMALWKSNKELLVTLPSEARIARADADTLDVKGYISAPFGVRAIAMDPTENLLFSGSIATGQMEIIDLATMKTRANYYLGPWLRTIEVIPALGTAYVSSNGAIYEVRYHPR
jgi:DNA-binding beta-propeller fold protein YncE